MTIEVPVEVASAPYEVAIGRDLLKGVGARLRSLSESSHCALVTDTTVAKLHAMHVLTSLARAEFDVVDIQVPAGESSKSWANAGGLLEAFAAAGLGREDPVVAVGGGVVGDLAGLVAGVYLRGVPFVQVPTTLLAMVDSSVGGKTAVDLKAGKNLAGVFKQPMLVVADVAALATLPIGEWRSGMAEVAKSAVLDGEEFVSWLEEHQVQIGVGSSAYDEEIVRRCVEFKASVVACDEREAGPRECLNYGHTLGHAIEKVAGYGSVSHGAAVAEGMRFAARVSVDLLGTDPDFVRRQDQLLDALGLGSLDVDLSVDTLLDTMHSDKKARGGVVRMVLADRPGSWQCVPVDDVVVQAHLRQWASTKRGVKR